MAKPPFDPVAFRAAWEEGLSFSQLGAKFGLSHGAVAGHCHRMGLKRGNKYMSKYTRPVDPIPVKHPAQLQDGKGKMPATLRSSAPIRRPPNHNTIVIARPTPSRKELYEELHKAVLNTGGRDASS